MKKHKQIVIYAEMEGKEITDIQVVRDFDDDETVLLFAHLYAKSPNFARLFNATMNFKDSLKKNEDRAKEYLKMLENVNVTE